MVRGRRRWTWMLLAVAAVAMTLAGGLAAVSRTAWFREWLRAEVATRASAAIPGRVAIGAIDGNLLSRVVLRDVRLSFEGKRVLAIPSAEATFDLWSIVRGDLGLESLTVTELDLRLVERDGAWNLARALAEETVEADPPPAEPTRFAIDRFVVADARVRVRRPDERWLVRRLRLTGALATGPDGTTLTLADAAFALARRRITVHELAATVATTPAGGVAVRELHLRTDGSRITGRAVLPAEGAVDVALDAAVAAAELRRLLDLAEPVADLRATIEAEGPRSAVAVDATFSAADATVAVAGTLDLAAAEPRYDLEARLADLDLAAVLGPARPVTDLDGTVGVEGSGTDLATAAAEIAVALRDSTVAGRTLASLDAEARLAEGAVRFDARTRTEAGRAEARGTVVPKAERYDVTLVADAVDPAPLLADPALAGAITGNLTVRGTGFAPATADAAATLELAASRIGELPIRSARAAATVRAGRLFVERLVVDAPALAAEASGELALAGGPSASTGRLRYDVQARDLRALGSVVGAPDAAGTLTVTGTASGSLTALDADAAIRGRALAYGATRLGTLTATVGARGVGAAGGQATLTAAVGPVHAGGQVVPEADLRVAWRQTGPGRSTADVALDGRTREGARHELAARVTIAPEATRIEAETLAIAVADDTWRADGRPVLTVTADGGVATDEITLRSGASLVRLAGSARATGASDLRLKVAKLDLATLEEAMARPEPRRLAGTLGAEAVLTGTLAAPRLAVDARIDELRIGEVPYAGATVRLVATPARAEVDAALTQAAGRALRLEAALPIDFALSPVRMAATGPIDGTLVADAIDLAFVDALTPALADVGGTLAADLTIGGTLQKLALRGPLTIAGGRARVPAAGLTYSDLDVAVRLDGQAAAVERLRVVSGKGSLAGSGRVRLGAEGPELDVRIELTRFPLFDNQYGRGAASGWLWASGTLAAPVIEGSLTTDTLVLQIPETLPGKVRPPDPTIEVIGPDAPPTVRPAAAVAAPDDEASDAPAPDVFANAAITIQLQVPRNAWIRRSDAEIELRGWITAWKKPAENLQLSGDINTVRGWFAFQGKNFDVTEGDVTFTGAGLNPNLRLVASHRAGEYTARVVIGGTLAKPTLTLESDPPLSQADILSVIVFGKPASELSSGESAGLREQALGVAAGYAASELRQSVARALGVDTLEFSGGGSLEEAEISAGKYVARDVFVSLAHKFGEAVEELRIQYFLTPRWTIETSTDTLGRSALDVFWKLRY